MSAAKDADGTKMRILSTLVLGVLLPLAARADQSELEVSDGQPISEQLFGEGKRQIETPEVVLQLKYDRGELNRIYLAQFRKNKERWAPSVPATDNLCADLCHSGLGGLPCGEACADMIPVGLKTHLTEEEPHENITDAEYGEPRVGVCPALCQYGLGNPLCACNSGELPVAWDVVCSAFCSDKYELRGCPACPRDLTTPSVAGGRSVATALVLSTTDGWSAWCNVQCRQGHGGAACNCDRAPFQ
ncbi:uncharacterized protein LOC125238882 [Leguminivora glycinivorella]|uniref:uncharacterized protein LOC125238882 n=1 Tax=Leguminivora glycinivorella TaxID=1035111 RepID=UPI00200FC804|nr:uncharacterized protein LOC125238882 [Leguminivora glycinivorella]